MVIVSDEAEMRVRAQTLHERFVKLCEGKSKRFKRRMERVELTEINDGPVKVRVLPKSEALRKAMVHPNGNLGFRETGSVEWPLDQFTLRRLRDGDVTLDGSYGHQPVRDVQLEPRKRGVAGGTVVDRRPLTRPARHVPPPTPPTHSAE